MTSSSNHESDLIMGAVMEVVWFFNGFNELKVKCTIQNIPTSKINTGAVGTDVEIKRNIRRAFENGAGSAYKSIIPIRKSQ